MHWFMLFLVFDHQNFTSTLAHTQCGCQGDARCTYSCSRPPLATKIMLTMASGTVLSHEHLDLVTNEVSVLKYWHFADLILVWPFLSCHEASEGHWRGRGEGNADQYHKWERCCGWFHCHHSPFQNKGTLGPAEGASRRSLQSCKAWKSSPQNGRAGSTCGVFLFLFACSNLPLNITCSPSLAWKTSFEHRGVFFVHLFHHNSTIVGTDNDVVAKILVRYSSLGTRIVCLSQCYALHSRSCTSDMTVSFATTKTLLLTCDRKFFISWLDVPRWDKFNCSTSNWRRTLFFEWTCAALLSSRTPTVSDSCARSQADYRRSWQLKIWPKLNICCHLFLS